MFANIRLLTSLTLTLHGRSIQSPCLLLVHVQKWKNGIRWSLFKCYVTTYQIQQFTIRLIRLRMVANKQILTFVRPLDNTALYFTSHSLLLSSSSNFFSICDFWTYFWLFSCQHAKQKMSLLTITKRISDLCSCRITSECMIYY